MEIEYQIEEIDAVAEKVVDNLHSNIILVYGEMGVGKTTFIKSLVKALGSEDNVSSPTYSLVNEYEAEDMDIFHFDLYRIKNRQEALDFGFEDYLNHKDIVLIEWPDKVLDMLPEKVDVITLNQNKDNSRTLKLSQNIDLTKQMLMTQTHFL